MIDDDEEAHAMHTDDDEVDVRARSKVSRLRLIVGGRLISSPQTPKPKKKRAAVVDPDGDDVGEDRPTKKTKLWVDCHFGPANANFVLQQICCCVE
jgi:hypothetical protein